MTIRGTRAPNFQEDMGLEYHVSWGHNNILTVAHVLIWGWRRQTFSNTTRSPVVPFYPFLGEGSLTEIDNRKIYPL